MKLHRKTTFSFICSAWILLFVIIFVSSRLILINSFNDLELTLAKQTSNRVYEFMMSTLRYLPSIAKETSYWDATYNYMNNRDPNYIKQNFSLEGFKEDDINFVAFIDTKENTVWKKGYNLRTGTAIPFPKKLVQMLKSANNLLYKKQDKSLFPIEDNFTALIRTKKQIIFLTLSPIFDENEEEPSNGTLLYAKILTPTFVDQLSKKIKYKLDIQSLPHLKLNQPISDNIQIINPKKLIAYRKIRNYEGRVIGNVAISIPRHLHLQSKQSANQNMLLLLLFSIIGIILMLSLIVMFFRKQESLTRALECFFPKEFIKLLERYDIEDIKLGNSIERNTTVLFSDIRGFSTLSEKMDSDSCFKFINEVWQSITPAINNHNGFVDKYIGDAIMAIFHKQDSPTHAVAAAIGIQKRAEKLNRQRLQRGEQAIKLGIGINTGEMMLGIVGNKNNLRGTATGDIVNGASRIEGLTKAYGCDILIGQGTFNRLDAKQYLIRFIDEVTVKGKKEAIMIYEVYDANDDSVRALKTKTKEAYMEAWQLYQQKHYQKASQAFEDIVSISPNDNAAKHLLNRCNEYLKARQEKPPHSTNPT